MAEVDWNWREIVTMNMIDIFARMSLSNNIVHYILYQKTHADR